MNVLVLLTSAFDHIGGIDAFNRALVKALDDLAASDGNRNTVFSLLGDGASSAARRHMASGRTAYRAFSGDHVAFFAETVLAGRRADHVIVGHINLSPLAALLGRRTKSLVVHGVDAWRKVTAAQRIGIGSVDRILSVSAYTQQALLRFNGMPPAQFHLFPNTLDPFYPQASRILSRGDLGLPPGPMLLSVARLNANETYKRMDLLIQCVAELVPSAPDVFCVIVGDGDDRPHLQQIAVMKGVADRVFFPGAVSDELLVSYYANCDVFVLPSLKEGFGIVFLEAMYHGKPCIGARAGAVPEVIEEGVTGLLAEPGDVASLNAAALRLLRDNTLAENMGRRGRERLERQYAFASFRQRLRSVLS